MDKLQQAIHLDSDSIRKETAKEIITEVESFGLLKKNPKKGFIHLNDAQWIRIKQRYLGKEK